MLRVTLTRRNGNRSRCARLTCSSLEVVIWADVVKTESRLYVFPNVVIASGGFKRVDPFTGIRQR